MRWLAPDVRRVSFRDRDLRRGSELSLRAPVHFRPRSLPDLAPQVSFSTARARFLRKPVTVDTDALAADQPVLASLYAASAACSRPG